MVGVESISYGKILGILISFLGCCLVAWQDDVNASDTDGSDSIGHARHSFLGDILAICAALGYGLYTPALTLWVGEEGEGGRENGEEEGFDPSIATIAIERGNAVEKVGSDRVSSSSAIPIAISSKDQSISGSSRSRPEEGGSKVTNNTNNRNTNNTNNGSNGSKTNRGPPKMPLTLVLGYVGLIITVTCTPLCLIMGILCLDSFCR